MLLFWFSILHIYGFLYCFICTTLIQPHAVIVRNALINILCPAPNGKTHKDVQWNIYRHRETYFSQELVEVNLELKGE